jgi:cytochrome c-type biogenesis protein
MAQWAEAFGLGAAAILTNACVLPLYPGLIAFMASAMPASAMPASAMPASSRRVSGWLGLLVLLGVLSAMLVVGFIVVLAQQTMGALLQYLLPLVYTFVIFLGALMLRDRNPFARLATVQTPVFRNLYASAYVYGLLFGPMTLPCAGPIITSAFVLGAGDARALADGLLYFLFFGLGFGLPLILLPLLAIPLQRRFVGWLAAHNRLLNRASGILLIAVGVFGILTELLPNYFPQLYTTPEMWVAYWVGVAVVVGVVSFRRPLNP